MADPIVAFPITDPQEDVNQLNQVYSSEYLTTNHSTFFNEMTANERLPYMPQGYEDQAGFNPLSTNYGLNFNDALEAEGYVNYINNNAVRTGQTAGPTVTVEGAGQPARRGAVLTPETVVTRLGGAPEERVVREGETLPSYFRGRNQTGPTESGSVFEYWQDIPYTGSLSFGQAGTFFDEGLKKEDAPAPSSDPQPIIFDVGEYLRKDSVFSAGGYQSGYTSGPSSVTGQAQAASISPKGAEGIQGIQGGGLGKKYGGKIGKKAGGKINGQMAKLNYAEGDQVTVEPVDEEAGRIIRSMQAKEGSNVKLLRDNGVLIGAVDMNDPNRHYIIDMDRFDEALGILESHEMAMAGDPRQAGRFGYKRNWENRLDKLNELMLGSDVTVPQGEDTSRPVYGTKKDPITSMGDASGKMPLAKGDPVTSMGTPKGEMPLAKGDPVTSMGTPRGEMPLAKGDPVTSMGTPRGEMSLEEEQEEKRQKLESATEDIKYPASVNRPDSAKLEPVIKQTIRDTEELLGPKAGKIGGFTDNVKQVSEEAKLRASISDIDYPALQPSDTSAEPTVRKTDRSDFDAMVNVHSDLAKQKVSPTLQPPDTSAEPTVRKTGRSDFDAMVDVHSALAKQGVDPEKLLAFVQDNDISQMVSEGRPSGVSTEKFVEQPPEGMPSGVSTERPFVGEPSVDVTEERSPDPNLDISKNPGNVRYVEGVDFAGGTGENDSGFATFDSDEAGLRVLFMTLQQNRYRDKTIAEIANIYSPSSENTAKDIQGKINVITQELARFGITGANSKVDVNDPEILEALARAIIKSEKTPEETEYYLNLPQNIWDRAQRDSTRDMQAGGVISFVQPKKFTPQEQRYLDFHRKNLDEGLGRENPDGSMTTILGKIISDQEGTAYLIPGYNPSNKKDMTDQEAWDRANEIGLENFPSAASVDLMRATEKELKEVINQDMEDYRKNMQAGGEVPQINKSGLIQGEGGPTSDSIPMKAEPDSFIINAPAVEMAGGKKKIDSMVNKVQKQQSVSGFNQFGNPVTGAQDINVSNGEYKVSKKDAQKIGYDTLNNINDAGKPFVAQLDSRGYAEGDRVSESQAEPMQVKFGDKTLNVTDQEIEGLAKLLYAEDRDTVATDAILGVIINRMNIALHTKKGKRDFVSTKEGTPVSLMNIMAYPNAFEPVSSNPIRNGVLTFDDDNASIVADLQKDKSGIFSNLKNLIKSTFNEINSKTYSNPAGKALWFQNRRDAKGTGLTENVKNKYFNTYSTRIIPQSNFLIKDKKVEFYEVNPDKEKVAASKKIDFNSSYDRDFYNKAKELNYNTSIPLPVYKPEGFMATEEETDRSTIEPADTSFINEETSPRISIVPTTQDLRAAGQNF